jgi:hypothetical protein
MFESAGGSVRTGRARRAAEAERIQAVSRGVVQERALVTQRLGNEATPEIIARMYAQAAVSADDSHGRGHGLIVQGDNIGWEELADLRMLLAGFADLTAHGGPGATHPDCTACDAATAYQRLNLLIDRVR